mgnify:CR=1 FL=1
MKVGLIHLPPMLLGALAAVEMSFKTAGIPYRKGGVDAAMAKLAR